MWLKINQLIAAMYAERYKLCTHQQIRHLFITSSINDFKNPRIVDVVYWEIGHRW